MAAEIETLLDAPAVTLLHRPGLVVLTGPPGSGRSTALRRLTAAAPGPAHTGGGLAMLQTVPALALSRAVRARLPVHDIHLLAEAVRSRVRAGLLVLDDLHYADPATLAAVPLLAAHCRVLVALRTPHRLPAAAVEALRSAATGWFAVPPLDDTAAADLARRHAAGVDESGLAEILARAGGNPLAITALARQAAAGRAPAGPGIDQVAYAIATALADLPRPARTALAALGLLGRPAPAALLGAGATDLHTAGLIIATGDGMLVPVSTYVAETAAGLLDAAARVDLHTRLADLTPPAEAARHLAAAGDLAGAHRRALQAADQVTGGERAALLLFACDLDTPIDPRVRIAAADAALAAGRPEAAARVLDAVTRPAGAATHSASRIPGVPGVARGGAGAPVPGAVGAPGVVASDPFAVSGAPVVAGAGAPDIARVSGVAGAPDIAGVSGVAGARDVAGVSGARGVSGVAGVSGRAQALGMSDIPGLSDTLGLEADVLRGEALLQAGHPAAARAAVQHVPDAAPAPVLATRDRVLLLAELAADPNAAQELAGKISARHPHPVPAVASALAAVQAWHRTPGWEDALAAAAGAGGDPLVARWSAWLLVEQLAADGRLVASATAALAAAQECAEALAYGWQTRFVAAADWALALHGPTADDQPATDAGPRPVGRATTTAPHAPSEPPRPPAGPTTSPAAPGGDQPPAGWDGPEGVLRRAANLTDRAIPDEARGYAVAATALLEADTGLLAAARARLDAAPDHPATAWVSRETAWLDGQPDRAARDPGQPGTGLLSGLNAITARWAGYDLGAHGAPPIPGGLPTAARRTLTAWATGTGFTAAAEGWRPVALRERVRCLLAAGLTDTDPARAVAALLDAERLADTAGLTVLAGRARRGLRRHHVHRDTRSPRSGDQLTRRETDVLLLVAAGEPTRRIANQLGISAETVDTHIRAGMRKLGARTRTEAAALAFAHTPSPPDTPKDGR